MANQSHGRRPSPPPQPVYPEPEVRRWPHPTVCEAQEEPNLAAELHFIHCSLSYQNQLLSEIRALLELCCAGEGEVPTGK